MTFAVFDRRIIRALIGVCAGLCGAVSPAAQDLSGQVHVDIAAQSLSKALTQFGRETTTEIEFTPDTVREKNSPAVKGDFDRIKAITLLLAGTGLNFRLTAQGAIVVEAATAPPPTAAPRAAAPGATADSSRRRASLSKSGAAGLDTITVEARTQREAVKKEIKRFIASITEPARDESLATWQLPICPLVAGMPRDMAEFVLRRISQTALDAHAPLAPEKCHPNLLLIVTAEPEELLRKWRRRYPRTFNEARGVAGIKRFIDSPLAVRTWYNVDDGCPGTLTYDITANSGSGNQFPFASCSHTGALGSRLTWTNVRVITSVILVADAQRIKSVNLGQFADYVGLIALAQIRLDKDPGAAPTILRLFTDANESRPQGLSRWDSAFLKSLYNTYPDNVVQISQMQTKMLEYLAQ
jgi:hypothetical protein